MARIKKSVDYFPHYIGGRKMDFIRAKYGNDGYAVWFSILEILAETDDHHIEFGKEMDLEMDVEITARRFHVSKDLLLQIIDDLVKLGQIHKALWEGANVVYSEQFRDSLTYAYQKRIGDIITTAELEEKYLALLVEQPSEQEEKQEKEIEDDTDLANTDEQTPVVPKAAPPSSPFINLHEVKIVEKKDFRNLLEKDVIWIQNQCQIHRIQERILWAKVDIFILQTEGEGKLIGRKYTDLRNHLQNWLRTHLKYEGRGKSTKATSRGNKKKSRSNKIIDAKTFDKYRGYDWNKREWTSDAQSTT